MKRWFIILCFVTNYVEAQPEQLDPLQQSFEWNKATSPTQQKSYSVNDEPMELSSMIPEEQNIMFLITCIAIAISLFFGVAIVHSDREKRRIYRSLNDLSASMSHKHEEVRRQADKLVQAYENMWKINQHLKEEVNFSAEKILLQNKKLMEYTNFNSHKLRGPLASLLGLISLVQAEEVSDNAKEMLQMLNNSASELDSIVQEFTQRLDSEL